MSSHLSHTQNKILYREHAAWQLLRSQNSPYILAFFADLFREENEVSFSQARHLLQELLQRSEDIGWETDTPANTYLNEWIKKGWLREMNDQLFKTDATELALRFSHSLEERAASTTASHLRIVQDAVRDFSLQINPDVQARIQTLQRQKNDIEQEISKLELGIIEPLSELQEKERIKEIYQLAAALTGDFRYLEEETRYLDKKFRSEMLQSEQSRGEVIAQFLEQEDILSHTEAGNAFDGFYQLLSDHNRQMVFRQQLQQILEHQVSRHLSPTQFHYLSHLMRELGRECRRVLEARSRTTEELRHYIESGAAVENSAVGKLLKQLEQSALTLRQQNCPMRMPLSLFLAVGKTEIFTPLALRPSPPPTPMETEIIEHPQNTLITNTLLARLNTVNCQKIARELFALLRENTHPLTLGELVKLRPISAGLEELVGYFRVAKAVQATECGEQETIPFSDVSGNLFHAQLPMLLLSAQMFPKDLTTLNL